MPEFLIQAFLFKAIHFSKRERAVLSVFFADRILSKL